MQIIKKVVVIGPESTGKSSLCTYLAQHYKTIWCPEFAREYLTENNERRTYNDLLHIAQQQIALEEKSIQTINYQLSIINSANKSNLLFIDTDMYVMKVWCEFVFNKCHPFILHNIIERKYDLYLLCNTDLAWEKDDLREYADIEIRKKLYYIYKDLLINQSVPWVEITGQDANRLQSAIKAVEKYIL